MVSLGYSCILILAYLCILHLQNKGTNWYSWDIHVSNILPYLCILHLQNKGTSWYPLFIHTSFYWHIFAFYIYKIKEQVGIPVYSYIFLLAYFCILHLQNKGTSWYPLFIHTSFYWHIFAFYMYTKNGFPGNLHRINSQRLHTDIDM